MSGIESRRDRGEQKKAREPIMGSMNDKLSKKLQRMGVPLEDAEDTALIVKYFSLVQKSRGIYHVTLGHDLDTFDIMTLHTVVRMATAAPDYQDLQPDQKAVIERFRGYCRRVMVAQGLTTDEAERMDKLLETGQGNENQ